MPPRALVLLAAALLLAPTAAGTWYAMGTYEPDTAYDATGGHVRADPDTTPTAMRLYFNVHPSTYATGTNANSGTLGSRVQAPGFQQWMALLGAWKDCNGDGYLGLPESAVLAYPASVLDAFGTTICPPGSFHHDGRWVYEYVPLGHREEAKPARHPRQIVDPDSRVWGDIGLPGWAAVPTCSVLPLPHGTTSGTGWALRYADCFTSQNLARAVNAADANGALGLRFEDEREPQRSTSLLNQHLPESLFGNPGTGETGSLELDSGDPAFSAWDCSGRTGVRDPTGAAPATLVVHDPTYDGEHGALFGSYGRADENLSDEDGHYAWIADPAPTLLDPRGSVADGLNATFRGFRVGGGDEDRDAAVVGGDCDEVGNDRDGDNTYSYAHQVAFHYADGPPQGIPAASPKTRPDVQFEYLNGEPTHSLYAELFGPNTPNSLVATPPTQWFSDPQWYANAVRITPPQAVDRATLRPAAPAYATFYAKVGDATLEAGWTTPGAAGTYGSEACGEETSGVHGGWECDPANWYRDAAGNDIMNPFWDVPLGSPFHFRDVDCADGTLVRGVGVQASLVRLSPGAGGDPQHTTCRDA